MKHARTAAIAIAATGLAIALGGAPAQAAPGEADLAQLRAVTAKYHDVRVAVADGYLPTNQCVPGMGYHYANLANTRDGVIDPLKPEVLLFVPSPDGVRLAGVEYTNVDADQNLATDGDRPTVFGQPFDGPMPGHAPGQPIHYDRHVWIWQHNPAGMFTPNNPNVDCG